MTDRALHLWTVYDHPRDHPTEYVARQWVVAGGDLRPTPYLVKSPKLNVVRAALRAMGLTCLPRDPTDEAGVVETWL